MSKKTILITGSTDGIGKLAAMKMAKSNHAVLLHGRSEKKLALVVEEIKSASNNQQVRGFVADLSDPDAVKSLAIEVSRAVPQLDVLINNAGVYRHTGQKPAGVIDIRFAVNLLAPIALTEGLLPILEKSTGPRVINLSSAAQSSVNIRALDGINAIPEGEAYAQSKLALTMWSFHLAKQMRDISVIAVNPGSLLNTKMVQQAFGQHWSPADKGADILVDLALSEKYNGVTGQYFDNDQGQFGRAHPDAYDQNKISGLIKWLENH